MKKRPEAIGSALRSSINSSDICNSCARLAVETRMGPAVGRFNHYPFRSWRYRIWTLCNAGT